MSFSTMGDLDGDVDGDMDGDVDGYVMGDDGQVVGYVMGDSTVGRRRRRRHRRMIAMPHRPAWRGRDAAPGVPMPGEGQEQMPLVPNLNTGIFDATNNGTIITFAARPQRPYRSERLLVLVQRTPDAVAGTPVNAAVSSGIFVGTTLSQATIGDFNIEFYSPTAFGVRMCLVPADPGIDVTIPVRLLGAALAGTQSIAIQMLFLGKTIQ